MVFSLNVQTLDSIHGYEATNKTGTELFGRNRRGKHYHAMIILVQATENVELSPVNCHIVIIATSMLILRLCLDSSRWTLALINAPDIRTNSIWT